MVNHSCELCTSLGVETKFRMLNDRKTHAQFHAFQLGYTSENGDRPSVKEIFSKCFPLDDFEKSEEIEKSRLTLMEICEHIIKTKRNDSNTIECQTCGANVAYKTKIGRVRTDAMLAHAGIHSTKKPIACRECPHETTSKSNIVVHIKKIHKIDSSICGVHFDENWNDCYDETIESLTKCFGVLDLDQALSSKKRTQPSELAVQRRSIFSKIVKNANKDKKIHCDQCQKKVCAPDRYCLEAHVYTHLHQRIHECKLCDVSTFHKCDMSSHLTKEHDVAPEGNYIDRSDEHHEEILDWVKKCFGKEAAM